MGFELLRDLCEHRSTLVERLVEAVLLRLEIALAGCEILGKLGIDVLVLLADHLGQLHGEARCDPQEAAVTDSTADETAENVVRADVAGLDAALRVAEDEGGRTHMVSDDATRLEREFGIFGRHSRKFIDLRHDRREDLGIIDCCRSGHHADRTLDAHAGIDIVASERLERAIGVLVVLHEDIVPDFDELAAMAARTAVWTALFLACVDEHLGVGAARTGRTGRTPPVVLARQTVDTLIRNAERLPDFDGLLIGRNIAALAFYSLALEHGHRELIRRKPELGGEELIAPADGLFLEIVVERPVAEHLEERKVCAVAHSVDVTGADALLDVGKARTCGMLHCAHQIRHQRMHAGGREKNRRIVLRNNRCARNALVSFGLKKREVHLSQLVSGQLVHVMPFRKRSAIIPHSN